MPIVSYGPLAKMTPPPVMIYYNKRLFAASALLGVWRVMSTLSTKAPGSAVNA